MTETEWLAGSDPTAMLAFVAPQAKPRKLRLLACGCVRLKWSHLAPEGHRAIRVAERFADGAATVRELSAAREAHSAGRATADDRTLRQSLPYILTEARYLGADGPAQAELVRDVYGNPFKRAVRFPREWKTSTVVALASGIYDRRAFDRLPILADALMDAGCGNDDVLDHCRDTARRHVRGCWVLDLLLGKG